MYRNTIFSLIIYCLIAPSSAFSETQKAPNFSLPGQNKTINLSQYKGKVVYLDFWASWCGPCKRSFPWMNKLQKQYGRDGFKVVAINLDTSRKDAEEFLTKIPANFDIAFDKKGTTAKTYNIKAMPSSFLIDKKGRLVHKSIGYRNAEKKIIEQKIQQLTSRTIVAKH
ncbi:MAG: TlpA family protein disulfide reductase [Gammaproteobacteria bacterium]|nr:TlpA family protein disulfide reductase [Gammaproteobacteria bacterium]